SIEAALRAELEARIDDAEAMLKAYRDTIDSGSGGMNPAVATTTTGNPAGVVFGLLFLMGAWLFATAASRSPANRSAAQGLGDALRRRAEPVRRVAERKLPRGAPREAVRELPGPQRTIDIIPVPPKGEPRAEPRPEERRPRRCRGRKDMPCPVRLPIA